MTSTVEVLNEYRCFGGVQRFYCHRAPSISAPMRFGVFHPDDVGSDAPALLYLAGLTCTEETFAIKAGAQQHAVEHGLLLVTPDTSPRQTSIDGAVGDWTVGEGAGFYVDATQPLWSTRFRMESYVVHDLVDTLVDDFGVDPGRISVFGHSMGGHGALVLALRHPGLFRSVSAFAPIAAPSTCAWGENAFSRYLGADRSAWDAHDASALMRTLHCPFPQGILIDQGLADPYLDTQLHPESLEAACRSAGQPLTLRRHAGYDHGYYFIASFVADHLTFHARTLNSAR